MIKPIAFTLCLGLTATGVFAAPAAVHAPTSLNPVVSEQVTHKALVADIESDRKASERLGTAALSSSVDNAVADIESDRKASERLSTAALSNDQGNVVADADSDRKAAERLS